MARLTVDEDYIEQTRRVARKAHRSGAVGIANARDALADLREVRQRALCLIERTRERLAQDR